MKREGVLSPPRPPSRIHTTRHVRGQPCTTTSTVQRRLGPKRLTRQPASCLVSTFVEPHSHQFPISHLLSPISASRCLLLSSREHLQTNSKVATQRPSRNSSFSDIDSNSSQEESLCMNSRNKSKFEPSSRRGAYLLVAAILILFFTAIFVGFPAISPAEPEMPIVHILLLKFKPNTSPATIQKVSSRSQTWWNVLISRESFRNKWSL